MFLGSINDGKTNKRPIGHIAHMSNNNHDEIRFIESYNIPNRIHIDNTVNQHGHILINFFNEANFCVLNSRFPDDNFTCILRKSEYVLDYIRVPIDVFKMITKFNVATCIPL